MLANFQKNIEVQFPQIENKTIGVAISGGVDSVVLAYLLHKCGIKICLLHCNFKLRGAESDADELFVKQFAHKLQIPFYAVAFQTNAYAAQHKLSIQIAARKLRYSWFQEMAIAHQLNFIATAHHANDNLETFLINLLRGTGIDGLTGIPKQNENVIRPLLSFSKNEILAYAEENNLNWREDASNQQTKYVRNKLRHQVVPVLKEIQPAVLQNLESTLTHLQQTNNFLKEVIQQKRARFFIEDKTTNGYKINIEKLKEEKHIEVLIFEFFKPYGFTAFYDIQNLLTAQTGKKVVSPTHILLKDRDHLLLYAKTAAETDKEIVINEENKIIAIENFCLNLTITDKFEVESDKNKSKNSFTLLLDFNKITFPLIVRKIKNGDYFYPAGMQGKKKLSKYFKDEKMSLPQKENTWLLCSKTEIIWVIGKRADRRFMASPETENILKITYEKKY